MRVQEGKGCAVASADTRQRHAHRTEEKAASAIAEPGARHTRAHGDREPGQESDKGDVHEF